MPAKVLHVDEAGLPEAVRIMQQSLDAAGIVIFPTETVYGLAARADMLGAVERIYEVKDRPTAHPLPVMVYEKNAVYDLAIGLDERFERLAEYFWPGPLTMVVTKNMVIDTTVTGGLRSVAIRIPSHEVPRALLHALPLPLAVTSANLSGEEPFDDEQLIEYFSDSVDAIILGDTGWYPLPSTVIDLTAPIPTITRQGAVERERIEAALRGLCEIR
jgi:L-threonylcarbamoyladenylate synthase